MLIFMLSFGEGESRKFNSPKLATEVSLVSYSPVTLPNNNIYTKYTLKRRCFNFSHAWVGANSPNSLQLRKRVS